MEILDNPDHVRGAATQPADHGNGGLVALAGLGQQQLKTIAAVVLLIQLLYSQWKGKPNYLKSI